MEKLVGRVDQGIRHRRTPHLHHWGLNGVKRWVMMSGA